MLQITRRIDARSIEIEASGRLTAADYARFEPGFDAMLRRTGPLAVLLVLADFRGWSPGGLWAELKFDLRHRHDFTRIAVVGDKAWQQCGTWLTQPLFAAPMRYFHRVEIAEARAWLASEKLREVATDPPDRDRGYGSS